VYAVDAAKPLAHVAIQQFAAPIGPIERDGKPQSPSCICRRAEPVPEHRLVNCKDVMKRTLGVEIAAERALVAREKRQGAGDRTVEDARGWAKKQPRRSPSERLVGVVAGVASSSRVAPKHKTLARNNKTERRR
jgi:hypothetical protein